MERQASHDEIREEIRAIIRELWPSLPLADHPLTEAEYADRTLSVLNVLEGRKKIADALAKHKP